MRAIREVQVDQLLNWSPKGPSKIQRIEIKRFGLFGCADESKHLPCTMAAAVPVNPVALTMCPIEMPAQRNSDAKPPNIMMPTPHWTTRTARGPYLVQPDRDYRVPPIELCRILPAHRAHMCNGPAMQNTMLLSHQNIRQYRLMAAQWIAYAPNLFVVYLRHLFHVTEIFA